MGADGTVIEVGANGSKTVIRQGNVTESSVVPASSADSGGNMVVQQSTQKDGTVVIKYSDGKVSQKSPDGTVQDVWPDGHRRQETSDGVIHEMWADGSKMQRDADGTECRWETDGTFTKKNPDGSAVIERHDGTVLTKYADGREHEKRPDGSSSQTSSAGQTIELSADGATKTQTDPDGTVIVTRTETNGWSVRQINPAGSKVSSIEERSDGSKVVIHSDGTMFETDTQGTVTQTGGPSNQVFIRCNDGTQIQQNSVMVSACNSKVSIWGAGWVPH